MLVAVLIFFAVYSGIKDVDQRLVERVKTLGEAVGMVDFLFLDADEIEFDSKSWRKVMENGHDLAVEMLDMAIVQFRSLEPWATASINDLVIGYADEHEIARGKAQGPIRVAVTGRSVGPPLWEALELLGRDETIRRLEAARARI